MNNIPPHKFHIPVMGLAYTIDSPIKVARFGISSAISIIEDNLVEMMRKYYYQEYNQPYIPITNKEDDYRARRITDYLNLVNGIVEQQVETLRKSAFEVGSDIVKYFEMLPEDSSLKQIYRRMTVSEDPNEKEELEQLLRNEIQPGAIEVNIMTKLDKTNTNKDGTLIEDGSDAVSALRGYAKSSLTNSGVVFSAGMNPRLFNYLAQFDDFDASDWGQFDKKVIIKVSDYRSALIQGKYLTKKGIWVSEFRIESGLNCGGHAFATEGILLGPILEEFKNKRAELAATLHDLYQKAIQAKGKEGFYRPHPIRLTVQGGIGTHEEDDFLHTHYGVDSTGWGTPFLLCPEATTVDEPTLEQLSQAVERDVILSRSSPLGVRFNYLTGTSGEKERLERIENGSPGSPCTEKFLISNTEFTNEPICTASKKYQKLKIEQLKSANLSEQEYRKQTDEVYSKECLCVGLSNSASIKYKQPLVKNLSAVTICPGPNIAYFSKLVSLQEMTDHIYGRSNILQRADRPHVFLKELQLYLEYLKEQIAENLEPDSKFMKYCTTFTKNLSEGMTYYQELITKDAISSSWKEMMERPLGSFRQELKALSGKYSLSLEYNT